MQNIFSCSIGYLLLHFLLLVIYQCSLTTSFALVPLRILISLFLSFINFVFKYHLISIELCSALLVHFLEVMITESSENVLGASARVEFFCVMGDWS